jgi:hypothetical protein
MKRKSKHVRCALVTASAESYAEALNAKLCWPPYNSAHEGFAILQEEVHELWEHVRKNQSKRSLPEMRKEAIQIAAVALRFASECCDEKTGRR